MSNIPNLIRYCIAASTKFPFVVQLFDLGLQYAESFQAISFELTLDIADYKTPIGIQARG